MKNKTEYLNQLLKHNSKDDLQTVLDSTENPKFTSYINKLLDDKQISKGDLIRKTTLDRTYTYQIFSGKKNPSQDKVIQLGLALNCNLEEVDRLLTLSNNASLYAKHKRDAVIIFAINNNHSVLETNELLVQYEFLPL